MSMLPSTFQIELSVDELHALMGLAAFATAVVSHNKQDEFLATMAITMLPDGCIDSALLKLSTAHKTYAERVRAEYPEKAAKVRQNINDMLDAF